MKTLTQLFNQLQESNRYSIYFSVFRVFVCLYLLKDIILSWDLIGLLYEGNSFLPGNPSLLLEMILIDTSFLRSNTSYFFAIYLVLILMLLFGIGRNFTALLVFICFDINQRLCHIILNGGDNLLKFILLYLIFADCYQYFSLASRKPLNKKWQRISNLCTNLAGLSICFHLCWIYFISALHKVHADVWFNGIATYYTLSLERFSGTPFNEILAKNGLFVTISTYMTLLIELFFPVLIWFKQTRWMMLIAGAMLHTSILVLMMLYGFQMIFIMTYGFFISNAEWKQVALWFNRQSMKLHSAFKNYHFQKIFTLK